MNQLYVYTCTFDRIKENIDITVAEDICIVFHWIDNEYIYDIFLCRLILSKLVYVKFQNFVSDFSSVSTDGAYDTETKKAQVNHVICEHFLRQGMLDIAEDLKEVCRYSQWLLDKQ